MANCMVTPHHPAPLHPTAAFGQEPCLVPYLVRTSHRTPAHSDKSLIHADNGGRGTENPVSKTADRWVPALLISWERAKKGGVKTSLQSYM